MMSEDVRKYLSGSGVELRCQNVCQVAGWKTFLMSCQIAFQALCQKINFFVVRWCQCKYVDVSMYRNALAKSLAIFLNIKLLYLSVVSASLLFVLAGGHYVMGITGSKVMWRFD